MKKLVLCLSFLVLAGCTSMPESYERQYAASGPSRISSTEIVSCRDDQVAMPVTEGNVLTLLVPFAGKTRIVCQPKDVAEKLIEANKEIAKESLRYRRGYGYGGGYGGYRPYRSSVTVRFR